MRQTELLKLWKLLFFINLLAHFIACVWHSIGQNTIDKNNNWLDSKQIRDESNFIKYIYSFYWSIVTMVTVGYGDITPQNYLEMILCIIIMFLSCGVYAYSLNTIGQIISILNHESNQLEKSFRILNKYFKQHNIKDELQSRIKNNLEYRLKEQDIQSQNVYKILDQLSNHLRFKIIFEIYQSMLSNCPLLKMNFSKSTLINSSSLLETLYYEPDDLIINQNFENENALYFIDQGVVELFEQKTKTQLKQFSPGESFGELEFFINSQTADSYRCKTDTRVFKLSRSKFLQILNKEDFEMFHQIKTSFEFNIPVKHSKCVICNQNDHLFHKCKLLFYDPDISKLIIRQENQIKKKQFEYYQQHIQENSQLEEEDDENVIIGPETQITSLLYRIINIFYDPDLIMFFFIQQYNSFRPSEKQIKFSNQMEHGKDNKNENVFKSMNTQVGRTKQSLPETGNNNDTIQKIKISDQPSNQSLIFDRMKDYNQYFSEKNYDLQSIKYNEIYFQRRSHQFQKSRAGKTMRFVQI